MGKLYKCTFIIPFHKVDDELAFKKLSVAIASYKNAAKKYSGEEEFNCVISTTNEFKYDSFDGVSVLTTDKGSSYTILVNNAINEVKGDTEYVSILEFDDKLTENALNIFERYEQEYSKDQDPASVFAGLAFILMRDNDEDLAAKDNETLVGISNESTFAPGVAEEYSKFDFNMMLRSNFLFLNGAFIKVDVFDEVGMLKENFDTLYDYEFTLRLVYNGIIVRSIPKITHIHYLSKNGAFETQKEMPKKLKDQWLIHARKEYFFNEERELYFSD
jgi:hypothetical protein